MDCYDRIWSSTIRVPHGGKGRIYAKNPDDGARMEEFITALVNATRLTCRCDPYYDSFGFLQVPQDTQGPDSLEWRRGINGNTDVVLGEYRFEPRRAIWQVKMEWSGCRLEIEYTRLGPALWAMDKFGRALEGFE